MKKSPKIFKESEQFIHVKEERTDTGIEQGVVGLIRKKVQKGISASEIAGIFEVEESYVVGVVEEIKKNPEFTNIEVVNALNKLKAELKQETN